MVNNSLPVRLPDRWPRAVVFDMDGLMLDTERIDREIWQAVLRDRGHDLPDALHDEALVGRSPAESDQRLAAHFGSALSIAEARAEVSSRGLERLSSEAPPHKPGLLELLDFLDAAAVPMAVATTTERARALLCLRTLASRFRALACGDEVTRPKPAPDIYLLAAKRLGIPPGECLALEDSPTGHAAALAAGMTTVLIPDLIVPAPPPPFICRELSEVTAWLVRLSADPLRNT